MIFQQIKVGTSVIHFLFVIGTRKSTPYIILANFASRQIREFKILAKIIIIIALLKKNENLRILSLVKNPKIRNPRKFSTRKLPDPLYAP